MTTEPNQQNNAPPPRRILMTRDAQDCAQWRDLLHPLNGQLTYFAPFTTRPVPFADDVRAKMMDAVRDDSVAFVMTSARALVALQHSNAELCALLRMRPFFAVGHGSAQALREAGFSRVSAADGDISSLVPLIALQAPQQGIARLVHLAGSVTVADLAAVMAQSPLQVETHVVYDAVLNSVPDDLTADIASGAISDIVLLSARVAQRLGDLAKDGSGVARLYCLSPRIADAARAAFAPLTPEIITTSRPDIAALLALLDAPATGLHNTTDQCALTK